MSAQLIVYYVHIPGTYEYAGHIFTQAYVSTW